MIIFAQTMSYSVNSLYKILNSIPTMTEQDYDYGFGFVVELYFHIPSKVGWRDRKKASSLSQLLEQTRYFYNYCSRKLFSCPSQESNEFDCKYPIPTNLSVINVTEYFFITVIKIKEQNAEEMVDAVMQVTSVYERMYVIRYAVSKLLLSCLTTTA